MFDEIFKQRFGDIDISKHYDAEWITNTILQFLKNKSPVDTKKMEIIGVNDVIMLNGIYFK